MCVCVCVGGCVCVNRIWNYIIHKVRYTISHKQASKTKLEKILNISVWFEKRTTKDGRIWSGWECQTQRPITSWVRGTEGKMEGIISTICNANLPHSWYTAIHLFSPSKWIYFLITSGICELQRNAGRKFSVSEFPLFRFYYGKFFFFSESLLLNIVFSI